MIWRNVYIKQSGQEDVTDSIYQLRHHIKQVHAQPIGVYISVSVWLIYRSAFPGGWLTAQIMTRPRTTLFFLHERNYLLGSTGTCPHGFLHVGGLFWECCNSRRGGIVPRSCRLEGPAPGHIYGPARHLPG